MHQTFYVDIDEEITSIVEKLRKTEAPEAVLVVPKRALLIQSIVNLKLLRKEADNLGLKVSIVTQDKLGKMLVQKAGIAVQQKVEEDDFSSHQETPTVALVKADKTQSEEEMIGDTGGSRKRLQKLGSSDFFSSGVPEGGAPFGEAMGWEELERIKGENPQPAVPAPEKVLPAKMATRIPPRRAAAGTKKSAPSMDVSTVSRPALVQPKPVPVQPSRPDEFPEIPFSQNLPSHLDEKKPSYEQPGKNDNRDKQLEQFFYANNSSDDDNKSQSAKASSGASRKMVKGLAIVAAIAVSAGLLYGAYLYLPSAKITLTAKKEIKSADLDITADTNVTDIDFDKKIIPAQLKEFDEEVSKTFPATGKKNVSDQKAKGKITIYNEFSSSPQPLVATTRFLTPDQKVFRLVQGVTVPGTTKVGNDVKPGAVEAEVVADEAGDSYNIGPTDFKIPGFQGSGNDKYEKIYAKSTTAMAGGGSGNQEVASVTASDISSAKDKISLEINDDIKQKVKDSADPGMVVLDGAISIDEPVYRLSNSEGEMTDNFEIKVSAHVRVLVFSENDAKKLANSAIAKSGNGKVDIDTGAVILDYDKAAADFQMGTVSISVHASNVTPPNIDLEALKEGLLGKNADEVADYLKDYPKIEKAEVSYSPEILVNRIPTNPNRVEVILESTTPE